MAPINTTNPSSGAPGAPNDAMSATADVPMASASPTAPIAPLPAAAGHGAWSVEPALHVVHHARGCPICDAYVHHVRGASDDASLRVALASTASTAVAEAAALRSQLAQERGAREQAERTARMVIESLGTSTSRGSTESSRDSDRLRRERDRFRGQVDDLQDTIRDLENELERAEAESASLALELERCRRRIAADRDDPAAASRGARPDNTSASRVGPGPTGTRTAQTASTGGAPSAPGRGTAIRAPPATQTPGAGSSTGPRQPRQSLDELDEEQRSRLAELAWEMDGDPNAPDSDEEFIRPERRKRTWADVQAGAPDRKSRRGKGKNRARPQEDGPTRAPVAASTTTGGKLPPPPKDHARKNWHAVRDRHWVAGVHPEALRRWESTPDEQIEAAVSGDVQWETGAVNVVQRELFEGVQNCPRNSRSALTTRVLEFGQRMADSSNHPILERRWTPEVRVGTNGAANVSDINARQWLTDLTARHTGGGRNRLWERVVSLVGTVFARPGWYAERVAVLFPGAPLLPGLDPENQTNVAAPGAAFGLGNFQEPDQITEDAVVQWLYGQLHVPRRAAGQILEPYFRRMARLRIARALWRQLQDDPDVPENARRWMERARDFAQRLGSRDPHPHAVERIALFSGPGSSTVSWQYPRDPAGPQVRGAETSWMIPEVRRRFEERYEAQVQEAEGLGPPPPPYAPAAAAPEPGEIAIDGDQAMEDTQDGSDVLGTS
ncbi:hypothetical protein FRC08_009255 [Ceratobasidium sp. 394]|nr:hypothetical protein FRC08_009255 [Ceratobasidium sp. 394]